MTHVVENVEMILIEINIRVKFNVILVIKILIGFVPMRDVFILYRPCYFLNVNKTFVCYIYESVKHQFHAQKAEMERYHYVLVNHMYLK